MNIHERLESLRQDLKELLEPRRLLILLLGTAILTFGLHNIHRRTSITEGGVLGMVLLLDNLFGAPPWLFTPLLDGLCYLLGLKYLGWNFIKLSLISSVFMSFFFRVWALFPPMLPDLTGHPMIAAILGGICVGVGVGIIVRQGGSSGGDDALALVISKKTGWRLSRTYLFTDLTVLGLSLTYIPVQRLIYSLITVTLSSMIIDRIQLVGRVSSPEEEEEALCSNSICLSQQNSGQ